jgi:hypothetical protein
MLSRIHDTLSKEWPILANHLEPKEVGVLQCTP